MKNTLPIKIRKQKFILEYLKKEHTANVLDAGFHQKWWDEFRGARHIYAFGSSPCPNAMTWLKKLYDQNILNRGRVGMHGMETGFPKWVYVYTLSVIGKRLAGS